ncbi:hypothetical protein H0H87_002709 [Tephrocybe sp. NHM501043]|nr:hypothetical protein H0H87_002709 [Tephrocybe sp. NHM501043]
MPQKSNIARTKAKNLSVYRDTCRKPTVEDVEDEESPNWSGDGSNMEQLDNMMDIIVNLEETMPDMEEEVSDDEHREEDEEEITEISALEHFMETLKKAHQVAALAERQKETKQCRPYYGNSDRTKR